MDQLGNILWAGNNMTYHARNSKQVDIVGNDEKRAYTLAVASSAAGDILPFQQVWAGKTKKSLPSPNAGRMAEALELGIQFSAADSKTKKTSHFSTIKTMKEVC